MPLTSNPTKLTVTIQCIARTVAECRGACGRSDSWAASPRKSADSAMACAPTIARARTHRQGSETPRMNLCPQNAAANDIGLATSLVNGMAIRTRSVTLWTCEELKWRKPKPTQYTPKKLK
jgi:hypothetical protein